MNKKVKYLVSLILLVIFPISAIGMDISIHKCKKSGTIHISFFSTSINCTKSNFCCSSCEMDSKEKQQIDLKESCNSVNSNQTNPCKKSCCESRTKDHQVKTITENPEQKVSNYGISHLNSSCCTDSDICNNLYDTDLSVEKNHGLIGLQVLSIGNLQQISFTSNQFETLTIKEVQFPLKKLITSIISFIHYTSISGDDTEVSNSLYR